MCAKLLLPELHRFARGDFFAVMALEAGILLVHHVKDGGDLLNVGDAVWVEAPDNAFDPLGGFHDGFFLYLEVVDLYDGCVRSHQRDFIQLFQGKKLVADLDDAFLAVFLAFQVGGKQHHVFKRFQFQDADHLEYGAGWNMIDDGAMFNGRYLEFFYLFAFHFVLIYCN